MRRVHTLLGCVVVLLCLAATGFAQDKRLTLDDLYDLAKRVNFNGNPPVGLKWLDDKYYLQGNRKVNALTGEPVPFFDAEKMEAAFAKLPGMTADDAKQIVARTGYRSRFRTDLCAASVNWLI